MNRAGSAGGLLGRRPLGLLVGLLTVSGLRAQDPEELDLNDPRSKLWGRVVHFINVSPPTTDRDRLLAMLKTKKDAKLIQTTIAEDLVKIYQIHRIRGTVAARPVGEDRVELFFNLPPVKRYERHEFKGLENLSEVEVRRVTGLRPNQSIHEDDADRVRLIIRDRYQRDGYYFASVEYTTDEKKRSLTFRIDEGPEVTVGQLRFRGNKTYPGRVLLGYGQNLQGSAKLESIGGVFGNPFSIAKVEDDIQKLELFYRRQGFLDAEVHLEDLTFGEDRSTVDLAFRVVEGERYRVTKVDLDLRRTDRSRLGEPSLYSKEQVMKELKLAPGDFYSSDVINRDKRALEAFYGKRGHPTSRRYGQSAPGLFRVLEPQLNYDPDKPELTLTYRLIEGEAKRLREVRIHGNSGTRDRVIRRRVNLLPGDVLDVTKLDRSRQLLDRTRYFQDPNSLSLSRFSLSPVESSDDEVDLDVYVQEGQTGRFLWGVGVSSGTGVRGNFEFQKRNFDIAKLPSSSNPGTIISEIASGDAFHGADQTLNVLLAPGSEVSFYRLSWFDPDIFRQHMDTIGTRVDLYKSIRLLDSFDVDRFGGALKLSRIFDETNQVSLTFRDETIKLRNIEDNAPRIVWEAEGRTEIRGLGVNLLFSDLDNPLHPRSGYNVSVFAELAGGPLRAGQDFYKLGTSMEFYQPFHTDSLERQHVIYTRFRLDHAETYGDSRDLYPSERYYMGGSDLRGFDQRRAGPSQFGQPVGGESRLLSTLEYQFPLVSTQMEGTTRHTEVIRGVIFSDFGLLGLDFNDSFYREPRLTVGFGIRIQVPVLQVPIQLDLAWPIFSEVTDREEQLYFSFRRF